MATASVIGDFELPSTIEAAEPSEARGLRRDDVRLLVSDLQHDAIEHAHFRDLPGWLSEGDVLVVNTSGTLNAAVPAETSNGDSLELHISTRLPGGFWTVELRLPDAGASLPFRGGYPGLVVRLPNGARATLLAPYPAVGDIESPSRLWLSVLQLPEPLPSYLNRYGFPIRYSYVKRRWPSSMYQTVF